MATKKPKEKTLAQLQKEVGEYQKKLNDVKVEIGENIIFIPTWEQIKAKLRLWAQADNLNQNPKDWVNEKTYQMASIGRETLYKWKRINGFWDWFQEKDDFQTQVDEGALRMLKRLESLAFLESGTAAVAACKAYLEMTTYKKTTLVLKDDVADMTESTLDKELAILQGKVIDITNKKKTGS